MTAGIWDLVAKGEQDVYINENPDITMFKMIYKRYTNFSTEIIPQRFSSNSPTFGDKVSATISRAGDLVKQIFLIVDLPAISPILENGEISTLHKMAWSKNIGFVLIKSIEAELGGDLIDKHYGEWLYIYYELTNNKTNFNQMIGNIAELTEFTNGKDAYRLYIPLQFWFNKVAGSALPLCNLQYTNFKINLEINDLSKCLIYGPQYYIDLDIDLVHYETGELLVQNIDNVYAYGLFFSFDIITKRLYYNRITNNSFLAPSLTETDLVKYYISGNTSYFKINPLQGRKEQIVRYPTMNPINLKDCFLLVEYIFLDGDERAKFINSNHQYLIEQIQYSGEKVITTTNSRIKLGFTNLCSEILWVSQYKYFQTIRNNEFFRYDSITNEKLIKNQTLMFNGKERVSLRDSDYFDMLQVFQNHSAVPNSEINLYSLCLYPEIYQPSGSTNLSQIDNIDLLLNLDKNVSTQNPISLRAYAKSYNILKIENGISGLLWI